jgi:3D (Asp-Asp-Asp) domain-containing protein
VIRLGRKSALVAVIMLVGGAGFALMKARANRRPFAPVIFEPTVVLATLRLDGAVVRGASSNWASLPGARARYGDPLPVMLSAYCLHGLTRRDRYVREGIVAADPKIFPLARYLEIYVGRKYFGRFLVDDTGKRIKGSRLDIWTKTCSEARRFGMQRGVAVLVPRPKGVHKDSLLSGRLGGPRKKG